MRMSKAKEKRQREAREAADVLQTLQELQQECTAPWIKSILERAEASLRPAAEAILRAEAHSQASAQQPYPGPPQQTLQGLTEEQRHEDKPNRAPYEVKWTPQANRCQVLAIAEGPQLTERPPIPGTRTTSSQAPKSKAKASPLLNLTMRQILRDILDDGAEMGTVDIVEAVFARVVCKESSRNFISAAAQEELKECKEFIEEDREDDTYWRLDKSVYNEWTLAKKKKGTTGMTYTVRPRAGQDV